MRSIHLARLDKVRPALLLTRAHMVEHLVRVTVAPITRTVRGLRTELAVGPANGMETRSVVALDNIVTIAKTDLLRAVGFLHPDDEPELARAIAAAFDLLQP